MLYRRRLVLLNSMEKIVVNQRDKKFSAFVKPEVSSP
jgi:hypothetical protein